MKAVQAHIQNVIFPTSACTAFQGWAVPALTQVLTRNGDAVALNIYFALYILYVSLILVSAHKNCRQSLHSILPSRRKNPGQVFDAATRARYAELH